MARLWWIMCDFLGFVLLCISAVTDRRVYYAPKDPKLTDIPHHDIKHNVRIIVINSHNIRQLGANEFSRYHYLRQIQIYNAPLNDNIHPLAFAGNPIYHLNLISIGLTHVPSALLSLNKTLMHLSLSYNSRLRNLTALSHLMAISPKLKVVTLTKSVVDFDVLPGLTPQMCRQEHRKVVIYVSLVILCLYYSYG